MPGQDTAFSRLALMGKNEDWQAIITADCRISYAAVAIFRYFRLLAIFQRFHVTYYAAGDCRAFIRSAARVGDDARPAFFSRRSPDAAAIAAGTPNIE